MPRLIFKCPHIKGCSQGGAHLKHYVGYIATREGVELLSPEAGLGCISQRENYMEYIALRAHHGAGFEPFPRHRPARAARSGASRQNP